MKSDKKKNTFTIAAILIACVFWLFDTAIHFFVYGEPQLELIPDDINELWMRSVIVLLICFFGLYTDSVTTKLLTKEKELEAARIYDSMLFANHHILNNLLNKMQLFKLEALRSHDFDQEILKSYDEIIKEASGLIRQLSNVEKITDEHILASVNPDNMEKPPHKSDVNYPMNKEDG